MRDKKKTTRTNFYRSVILSLNNLLMYIKYFTIFIVFILYHLLHK